MDELERVVHAEAESAKELVERRVALTAQSMADVQSELRRRMDDIEKSTIWKINDCAQMLKHRPTDQFVAESLRITQEKLTRELGSRMGALEFQQERLREEFRKRLEKTEDAGRQAVSEQKELFKKVLVKLERKAEAERVHDLGVRVERLKLAHNEQMGTIGETFRKHDNDLQELYRLGESTRHKLNAIEQEYRLILQERYVTKDKFGELETMASGQKLRLADLEALANKTKMQYDNLAPVFSQLEGEMAAKVNRDEIRDFLDSALMMEKIQKMIHREADKIRDEVECTLRQVEQRFGRLNIDADVRALQRAVKCKANAEDLHRELGNHEFRFQSLEGVQQQVNDEMQLFASCIENLQKAIEKIKIIPTELLAGSKGFTCLSCGRNEYGQIIVKSGSSPHLKHGSKQGPFEEGGAGAKPGMAKSINIAQLGGSGVDQFFARSEQAAAYAYQPQHEQFPLPMPSTSTAREHSTPGLLQMKHTLKRVQRQLIREAAGAGGKESPPGGAGGGGGFEETLPPLSSARRAESQGGGGYKSTSKRSFSIDPKAKRVLGLKDKA